MDPILIKSVVFLLIGSACLMSFLIGSWYLIYKIFGVDILEPRYVMIMKEDLNYDLEPFIKRMVQRKLEIMEDIPRSTETKEEVAEYVAFITMIWLHDNEGIMRIITEGVNQDELPEVKEEEKPKLRPIAEILAVLAGNAFFYMTTDENGDDTWYENYLPEAKFIYEEYGGGDKGASGEMSFSKPYVKE